MYRLNKCAILIIGILYLFAYYQGGRILYLSFYFVTVSFLLSILITYRGIKNISIYQMVDKREFYVGDEINIQTKVYNEGLFPIQSVMAKNLTINNEDEFLFFLKPLGSFVIEHKYIPKIKGRYKLGPVNIVLKDFFNIFSVERNYYENKEIIIYPKVYKIDNLNFISKRDLGFSKSIVKGSEDLTEIIGIRKYVHGESLKKVHWKISAKKRTLYVKNFDTSISKDLILFVDCIGEKYANKDALLFFEKVLEIVASIVYFSLDKQIETDIYFNTNHPLNINLKNSTEFIKLLDLIVETNPDGNKKITDFIKTESGNISKNSNLLIVKNDIGMDEAIDFAEICSYGYKINIILPDYTILKDEVTELLKSNGTTVYKFKTQADFGELVLYE